MTSSTLSVSVAKLLALPAQERVPRAMRYLRRRIARHLQRLRDRTRCTYHAQAPGGALYSHVPPPDVALLHDRLDAIAGVTANFLAHRFDYLGSGWIRVCHGVCCPGFGGYRYDMGEAITPDRAGEWLATRVNRNNLPEAQRVWSLVDASYEPIDWQLDFRSGFRWSELTWAQDVPVGHLPGVDIKVPWELARMQHLPQLAIAYACARSSGNGETGLEGAATYEREFRNQVLDFIATNPPRFGVNWRSAMDAGIRAVNILIAYDLFRSVGAGFDERFEYVLRRSIREHGSFIIEHFGWDHLPRGNHYFAHVVGLLFISAYLPCDNVTNAWLAFAIQELLSEAKRQFNADGSNFEGSTSYHRLSGEMWVYATALLAGLPQEKRAAFERYDHTLVTSLPGLRPAPLRLPELPSWYGERIERLAEFVVDITKQSGRVMQVGDNDSGRFLRLMPTYEAIKSERVRSVYEHLDASALRDHHSVWWDEQILDHRHLVAAVAGLVERSDFVGFAATPFETSLVSGMARGFKFRSYRAVRRTNDCFEIVGTWQKPIDATRFERHLEFARTDLRGGLRRMAYPDFGLYIFRSERLFLAVRCGNIGQEGNGGHAHNDQLTIELEVDGIPVFADPGSYVYTALPAERNRYRSDAAHYGFRSPQRESSGLDAGLFTLRGDPKGRCVCFSDERFVGEHTGYGFRVVRVVEIKANEVHIEDFVDSAGAACGGLEVKPFYASETNPSVLFSPGYGKLLAPQWSNRDKKLSNRPSK